MNASTRNVPPAKVVTPDAPPLVPERRKQIRTAGRPIDYVSDMWTSIDAIARDMKVDVKIAYRKLYYLEKHGLVQHQGIRWRKVLKVEEPVPAFAAKRRNGRRVHAHH